MTRIFVGTCLMTVVLAFAGCTSPQVERPGDSNPSSGATRDSYQVAMKDNIYEPATYNATAGVAVTWKNVGEASHTVTVQRPGGASGDYLYNKELIGPGGTAEFAFQNSGTYDVFCSYHSQGAAGDFSGGMVMKVVVS